jgi:hypothetical protein
MRSRDGLHDVSCAYHAMCWCLDDALDIADVDHAAMHVDVYRDTLQYHHGARARLLVANPTRLD